MDRGLIKNRESVGKTQNVIEDSRSTTCKSRNLIRKCQRGFPNDWNKNKVNFWFTDNAQHLAQNRVTCGHKHQMRQIIITRGEDLGLYVSMKQVGVDESKRQLGSTWSSGHYRGFSARGSRDRILWLSLKFLACSPISVVIHSWKWHALFFHQRKNEELRKRQPRFLWQEHYVRCDWKNLMYEEEHWRPIWSTRIIVQYKFIE